MELLPKMHHVSIFNVLNDNVTLKTRILIGKLEEEEKTSVKVDLGRCGVFN